MFKVTMYGLISDVYGNFGAMDIKNVDFEQLSSDNVAVVIIEDKVTSIKRYILAVNTQTRIVRNEITQFFRKSVTLQGSDGNMNWAQIIGYCDAEIFLISVEHMLKIVEILMQDCIGEKPFWYMNEKVRNYALEHHIACYTNIAL